MNTYLVIFIWILASNILHGQTIHSSIPAKIEASGKYLLYLHGRIVEEQGINAVHPHFGRYEYLAILDTLAKNGFQVISEIRPKNTDEVFYANKVAKQIDSLLFAGVHPQNIFVLGASKGAYISLLVAGKIQNKSISYILMGTCSDETAKDFKDQPMEFCGRFLSIFELSDSFASSCKSLLEHKPCVAEFSEITLTLGMDMVFYISLTLNGYSLLFSGQRDRPLRKLQIPGGYAYASYL